MVGWNLPQSPSRHLPQAPVSLPPHSTGTCCSTCDPTASCHRQLLRAPATLPLQATGTCYGTCDPTASCHWYPTMAAVGQGPQTAAFCLPSYIYRLVFSLIDHCKQCGVILTFGCANFVWKTQIFGIQSPGRQFWCPGCLMVAATVLVIVSCDPGTACHRHPPLTPAALLPHTTGTGYRRLRPYRLMPWTGSSENDRGHRPGSEL